MRLHTIAVAVAALAVAPATILAQTVQYLPGQSGVSYRVNIPSSTSKSGSGPIYFQLQAPASDQWIGLGQGAQMAGANIFIMYAASDTNVTLSPRSGKGEFQPLFNSDARISLVEGTGISNGVMTANVRCDNCLSWNGGTMDPTDPKAAWIWSVKHGSAIDSTSTSQSLQKHDIMGSFTFDLTKATGGSSQNPFAASVSGSATSTSPSPSATSDSSNGSGSGSSSTSSSSSTSNIGSRRKAHCAIMAVSFAILFPLAALALHLPLKIATVPLIHAPLQLLGLCLIVAGLGLGISLAQDLSYLHDPVRAHVVIGIIVVSTLVLFQPALGLLQHLRYRKTSGKSIFAFLHRWLGRVMVVLGLINGGLGFRLAGVGTDQAPNGTIIAYSVVAGVVAIVYLLSALFRTAQDLKGNRSGGGGEKLKMESLNGNKGPGGGRREIMSGGSEAALTGNGRNGKRNG